MTDQPPTDRFDPRPADSYASSTWTDPPWPVPRVLRPGFTFSGKPRWADGPLGAVTVLAMTCAVGLAWRKLGHSPGAQRAARAVALGWLACVVVIVRRIPDNAAWNHQWEELVRVNRSATRELAETDPSMRASMLPTLSEHRSDEFVERLRAHVGLVR